MSSFLSAEITATCGALGYLGENSYIQDPNCKESVRDLIRFLKRDDEEFAVRRQVGDSRVLVTDLIHILCSSTNDMELFDYTLRLMVNLSSPAQVVFGGEFPQDVTKRKYYMEIVAHLQTYKEIGFNDENLWSVLTKRIEDIIKLDWENRQSEDTLQLERLLILVRNILHVPANVESEKRASDDSGIHDQILWLLRKSGLTDVLLYIAGASNEQQFCLHVLEIVTLILKEQEPEQLANSGATRTLSEKEKDEQELLDVRRRENFGKIAKQLKQSTSRHSRFGGTFYVKNVKAISDRELLVHSPITKLESISFDKSKNPEKVAKRRKPMQDVDATRESTVSIRVFLKDMCVGFVNDAYNLIMRQVKNQILRQSHENHDESFYMWAIKFFMEFNRHNGCKVDLVSETLSVGTLHFLQTQMDSCVDAMDLDKKALALWSKRCHLALRAYKELVMTVCEMEKSRECNVRESCNVIKGNLFYMLEYRDLPLKMLHCFEEVKYSKLYLKDLVEMVHIYLKMLEKQSDRNKHFVVERKKRLGKKRNAKKTKKEGGEKKPEMTGPHLEQVWTEIAEAVSSVIKGSETVPQVMPFDPASETSIDDQKSDAMKQIHGFLRNKQVPEAIALLRASREVWPENNLFGAPDINPDDEFLAVREIFFTSIEGSTPDAEVEDEENVIDDLQQDDDDEEERGLEESRVEQEFKFSVFIKRFASRKVLHAYGILLRDFSTNSTFLNHCIVKMLHRIAWDCKIPAMLFQASIFRTFQHLLNYPAAEESSNTKEMVKFARFLLSKFFQVAQSNCKVFTELLFWKSARDAIEIVDGYGSTKDQPKSGVHVWTEQEEEELKVLFERHNSNENIDVVEKIMEDWNGAHTRKQIMRQLVSQGLLSKEETRKLRNSGARERASWSGEEVEQVVSLYNEHKDSIDVMGKILENMTVKRSKRKVIEKLLELGTVTDRKQLRKRRAKKEGTKQNRRNRSKKLKTTFGDDGSSSDIDGTSDGDGESTEHSESSDDERQKVIKIMKPKKCSESSLKTIALTAVTEGLREQVSWIRNEILGIAADRDAEAAVDATPIVPLTEESLEALDNETFKRLLQSLGFRGPANEQESFWRCPEELVPAQLRQMSFILTAALNGDLELSQQVEAQTPNNDGKQRKTTVKSSRKNTVERAAKRSRVARLDSDESDKDAPVTPPARNPNLLEKSSDQLFKSKVDGTKKRSRVIKIDSDQSDSDNDKFLAARETPETIMDLDYDKSDNDDSDVSLKRDSSPVGQHSQQLSSGDMNVEDNIRVLKKGGKKRVLVLSDDHDEEDNQEDSHPVRGFDMLQEAMDSSPEKTPQNNRRKRARVLDSDSE